MIIVTSKAMWLNEDPTIMSYARPLTQEEKMDLGTVNFAEESFLIGVVALINMQPSPLPPEVGKLVAWIETSENRVYNKTVKHEYTELKSCKEFFTQEQLDNSGTSINQAIQYDLTYCIDPEKQDASKFSDYTNYEEDYTVFYYGFRTCHQFHDSEVECLSDENLIKWFEKNRLEIKYGYL